VGRKPLIVALLVSTAINLVAVFTFGFYWHESVRGWRGPTPLSPAMQPDINGPFGQLQGRLKLSDAQRDTIWSLERAMASRSQPIRQQLFETRGKLMAMMNGPGFDRVRSDSLFRATTALQDQLEQQVYENMLSIRPILIPEQRDQLGILSREFMSSDQPPDRGPGPGLPPEPGPVPPMGAPGR
jgi:Spy/CpxP family protein refolding chaperone